MLEAVVEARLKRLEGYGFEVLKLRTPGYNGTKDRLILAPVWSPSPKGPAFVEIKRPGKSERALQEAVRDDWRKRGCDVRDMCSTLDEVEILCDTLLMEAVWRVQRQWGNVSHLPAHIRNAYTRACAATIGANAADHNRIMYKRGYGPGDGDSKVL
jgi:hypothetical protein